MDLWYTALGNQIEPFVLKQYKEFNQSGVPWYIKNHNLHTDLRINTVKDDIKKHCSSYTKRLRNHPNQLACDLLNPKYRKRLKQKDTIELGIT